MLELNQQLRPFAIAIGLFVLSSIVGTVGYMVIEDYDLLSAFYMTTITLSTVGFTEVRELSDDGRLFTSIYIIANLGVFAYVVSVITTYLFEGKLRNVFDSYMMDRTINKLNDHVIVCGYGRNGSQACEELIQEGKEFVVIEKNPEVRQSVTSKLNFQMIIADAALDSTLKLAGIDRAKEIIITTPSDAANVFITLTARELNEGITIISRASEQETEKKLYIAGADKVILPDHLGGMFMAQMVTKPEVIEFLNLLTGRSRGQQKYTMIAVRYEKLIKSFKDKTLKELQIHDKTGGTVVAVKDDVKGMIPNPPPETLIGPGDTMIILCTSEAESEVRDFLQMDQQE